MHTHSKRIRTTGVAAAATASLAVAMVGFTPPANATSAALTYTCTVSGNDAGQTFTVTEQRNGPATMYVGQSAPIRLTSTVKLSPSFSDMLYAAGDTVDGSITALTTIAGVSKTSTLAIPKTPVVDAQTVVVGTGRAGTFRAAKTGTVALTAGDFTSTLHTYAADVEGEGFTVACTAPSGVDTTFSTITVKKDTTKTTASAKSVHPGKKAVVKVTVKSKHGMTATGKVKVVLMKGKKVITQKAAALKKGMVTVTLPKRLTKKGTYRAVATYAGSKNFVGSKSSHKVSVK